MPKVKLGVQGNPPFSFPLCGEKGTNLHPAFILQVISESLKIHSYSFPLIAEVAQLGRAPG
ncbi:MAG: hypothetical protein PVH12_01405 [Candidatus Bathyarchaeota archaeon]